MRLVSFCLSCLVASMWFFPFGIWERDLKPLFWLTGSDEDLGFSLARRVCLLKIFVHASGLLLLLHLTYQEVSDLVLKESLRIEEHRRRRKRKENRWRE